MITVGDRVTETMDRLGRTPDVQVVDEVERRVRRVPPEVAYARLLKAKNPAGTITKEAMAAIDGAVSGPLPSRVLVEGEEDLLVIPAIKAAPVGATIYYGQPGKGVVLVVVDERAKASAERLLASMAAEE